MSKKDASAEKRLQSMKKLYNKLGEILDGIPDDFKYKNKIKDLVLGDKELKKLMEGIEHHRSPRLFMIGRTGVGKSSLINALCGEYVASVSDTHSKTECATSYQVKDGDRVLMEIMDSRGFAETERVKEDISAEDKLLEEITEFGPDVVIFVLSCMHRDDVIEDIEFLKKLGSTYKSLNKVELPIVAVVNKCDEMSPSRLKDPKAYSKIKIDKINEVVANNKKMMMNNHLKIYDIIAVSSLIDWATKDGTEIDADSIDYLPQVDKDELSIIFDGRYNIDKLLDILEDSINDFEAKMGLKMAARLNVVIKRIAQRLNMIFSTIAATLALSPIPISDLYMLITLQSILVLLIATLSGKDSSLDAAKEFIFSLGGVAGAGVLFRLTFQQLSKLFNAVWPGSGSVISSNVAAWGTYLIGKAAISYYIEENNIENVIKRFEKERENKNYKIEGMK